MPFSLNDVRVMPLANHGDLIKVETPAAATSGATPAIYGPMPTPYAEYGKKHHDDDVPFAAIPITAIVFTFIYLIVKAIMAPFNNRNRQPQPIYTSGGLSEEEVAILHKLQRTLSQMESRVEALETILIDQARTEKHYGSKL